MKRTAPCLRSVPVVGCVAAMLCLGAAGVPAFGQVAAGTIDLQFDTELVSMDLTGGPFPMPLAPDPTNQLGDSIDGYGFVDSMVLMTLSSQRPTNPGPRSLGEAYAIGFVDQPPLPGPDGFQPVNPDQLDGCSFVVDSFFDVFFDITVTDVDPRPGRDFAGQPDGASVGLQDNGPAGLSSFREGVIFDKEAPNFGLIPPPEEAPLIGFYNIEIPLGGDINGNGENDKVKFTLGTISVQGENRTFIILPDGTTIDQFDSAAFLEGAIVDESADPPFTIGAQLPGSGLPDPAAFGGPMTMTSRLLNPVVPEPLTVALLAVAAPAALLRKRRRA